MDHLITVGEADPILNEIESFLAGVVPMTIVEEDLATVLAVKGATPTGDHPSDRGDSSHLVAELRGSVRRECARVGGRELPAAGTALMVTFSWPSRAVACAAAVREASVPLGFAVRSGVHIGECAVVGDHLRGPTVRVSCARRGSPIIELLASRDETGWVTPCAVRRLDGAGMGQHTWPGRLSSRSRPRPQGPYAHGSTSAGLTTRTRDGGAPGFSEPNQDTQPGLVPGDNHLSLSNAQRSRPARPVRVMASPALLSEQAAAGPPARGRRGSRCRQLARRR